MKNIIKNIIKKNNNKTKTNLILIDDSTAMPIYVGEATHKNMEWAKAIIAQDFNDEYWRIYII